MKAYHVDENNGAFTHLTSGIKYWRVCLEFRMDYVTEKNLCAEIMDGLYHDPETRDFSKHSRSSTSIVPWDVMGEEIAHYNVDFLNEEASKAFLTRMEGLIASLDLPGPYRTDIPCVGTLRPIRDTVEEIDAIYQWCKDELQYGDAHFSPSKTIYDETPRSGPRVGLLVSGWTPSEQGTIWCETRDDMMRIKLRWV